MNNLGSKLVEAQQKIKQLEHDLKEKNIDYKVLDSKFNAMSQEKDYWEQKFNLLQKGAVLYTMDQFDYIDNAVLIPAYFESTFVQVVPKEIGTTIYNANRFYKVVNGNIEIDIEKYNEYKRRLILWLKKQ